MITELQWIYQFIHIFHLTYIKYWCQNILYVCVFAHYIIDVNEYVPNLIISYHFWNRIKFFLHVPYFYYILSQTYNNFPFYISQHFYWDKQQQQQHQPRTMGHPDDSVDSIGSSRCYCRHRDAIHTYVNVMNNARIISFSNVLSIQDMKKVTVRIENPSLPSVILKTYELHY